MLLNTSILIVTGLVALVLFAPRLRGLRVWGATITPLASIIGSGFLVLGPLLSHAYGSYAWLAMLALCALAWGFGSAIRFNIAAIGTAHAAPDQHGLEQIASWLLGFAYMISVAYYLNLFGAFALSLTPFDHPFNARLLTCATYALILLAGWTKGFSMLERLEYGSVALKLAIICGLFVGLGVESVQSLAQGDIAVEPPHITGWAAVTLGFGLIVTVQGFETSRYLGHEYDPQTRIRSMRLAQLVATGIYVVYILMVLVALNVTEGDLSETAIIDMIAPVATILPFLLVAAALAAQFSAAVADTGGTGGLLAELSGERLSERQAYALTAAVGILITWSADVFQIISYASRAFAAYYGVQALIAALRARHKAPMRAMTYLALAFLAIVIVIFGQSVE